MANQKPTIFITASTGWATRNFFQTGVIEKLTKTLNIVVLASPSTYLGLKKLNCEDYVELILIECGEEPILWKLMRQLKKKIYLDGRKSVTEALWEFYNPRPFYQNLGGRIIKYLNKIFEPDKLYQLSQSVDLAINRSNQLNRLFEEKRPSLVFATHATTYFEEYIFRNAYSNKIPVAFMVLSWDHLSSKITLHNFYSFIFVWNSQTRFEILSTYKFIKGDQIRIVGVPQYDLYAKVPDISYEQWCAKYGLDSFRKTILFSTMPQIRHNQQHIILEDLLTAIEADDALAGQVQILVKCHPFDTFDGYEALGKRFKIGIQRSTLTSDEKKEEWVPCKNEIVISRDCLYFSTVNINIFSTVTIEACYFNKPVINIAYDPIPQANKIPCRKYYCFDHFKPIVDTGATDLVYSKEELVSALKKAITEPEHKEVQRRILTSKYIGQNVGKATEAVVESINSIVLRQ